jgi:hypothetical protein
VQAETVWCTLWQTESGGLTWICSPDANKLSDLPDFNDATKLCRGKEMVDRLTNLIAIFETPALDFSKNRAEGDDILGDAYEYFMRHFATESGKRPALEAGHLVVRICYASW